MTPCNVAVSTTFSLSKGGRKWILRKFKAICQCHTHSQDLNPDSLAPKPVCLISEHPTHQVLRLYLKVYILEHCFSNQHLPFENTKKKAHAIFKEICNFLLCLFIH